MWYRLSVLVFVLGIGLLAVWTYSVVFQGSLPVLVENARSDDSQQRHYRKRTSWRAINSTSPNISVTVFNDANRNGLYDADDRPMMRVAVRLHRPDGSHVVRRTNMRGFANFNHSATASPVAVSEPGAYRYEVLPPPGWTVTSGNATQSGIYELRPETRPGIVVDRVPQPVGLAQELFIEGRLADNTATRPDRSAGISLEARSPQGVVTAIPVDREGRFHIPAEPGTWQLRTRPERSTQLVERTVQVGSAPVYVSATMPGPHVPEPLPVEHAVDFDRVTPARMIKMYREPNGLHWANFIVLENEFYSGEGYINNTVSGRYLAYNTSGHPAYIEHTEGFDFVGAYFGVAWFSAEGEHLEVRAWRDGQLVAEDTFELSAMGPVWFDADYRSIHRLEISTRHYWQFVMDDPVFRLPAL